MQFVKNGPELPNLLLHQHEDGGVIFFCGAGISYPAQLPEFGDLVRRIYAALHTAPNPIEAGTLDRKQFDATLGLLEQRIPGGRSAARDTLFNILKPNLRKAGAKDTHKALLTLARDRRGAGRLVTTNFDRIFESVMRDRTFRIPTYSAPLLPIPKDSKWHGLVYLHGLLPKDSDSHDLNSLVLSSGDFGLAYLTERWASRFVSELFRNYVVCFVGYSIDDPVLRYMMDALAADRMLGESIQPAYAFASYSEGRRDQTEKEWRAKQVIPILYEVPAGTHDHSVLHATLKSWAETYRDGVNGKEQIVVQYALTSPSASTVQDDFVGRLIWALSDKSGLSAKRFSELDPLPSLDWLKPMRERPFRHADLVRYGVAPNETVDEKLEFGLIHRPSPYALAPWMSLITHPSTVGRWDHVMEYLARWLARHVSNPELIIWIAGLGGVPNPFFAHLIRQALKDVAPESPIGKLWSLILGNQTRIHPYGVDLFQWFRDLSAVGGLNPVLRSRLREMLRPKATIAKPIRLSVEANECTLAGKRIRDLVDSEVVLASDHAHVILRDRGNSEIWSQVIGELLEDLTDLLREALDLMQFLESAEEKSDFSYIHQPSIAQHPQNQHFQDWTTLVDLVRDAWLAVAERRPVAAYREVERWQAYRYPIFRRLTLFAATYDSVFSPDASMDWLLADNGWWLWSSESQREALQLLGKVVLRLPPENLKALEQTILQGPAREMYRTELNAEQWQQLKDEAIWLRLAIWEESGVTMPPDATARIEQLKGARPHRQLRVDERSQFSFWMGSNEDWRKANLVPASDSDLLKWLREYPEAQYGERDDWADLCKAKPRRAARALVKLARDSFWPADRWRDALQAWSDAALRSRSWRFVRQTLQAADEIFILGVAHPLVWWLRSMSEEPIRSEDAWLALIGRVFAVHEREAYESDEDPVGRAINHPVGQSTESLIHWWYQHSLRDGQGLDPRLARLLTIVCDLEIKSYRNGRLLLAQDVINLFRVDPAWATQYVLPLFNWDAAHGEARLAWEGFLWTPRIYFPLLAAIKADFLGTATHYAELGKHREQYATFLTYVALQSQEVFTTSELADALASLGVEGLVCSALGLVQALQGAGGQRQEFWQNRVVPFLVEVWPKSTDLISTKVAAAFAELCIAADKSFPDALHRLRPWFRKLTRPDYPIHLLSASDLCAQFPDEALELLDAIMSDEPEWPPSELPACLEKIRAAKPQLVETSSFRGLVNYARAAGLIPTLTD